MMRKITVLVRHILTRIGFTTGEIMVCLIVNGTKKQLKHIDKLVDDLKTIEGMTSIIVNTNTDKTNKILGLRCRDCMRLRIILKISVILNTRLGRFLSIR